MSVGPVVVGVDNTVDSRSAVLWAVQEAALSQTSLLIVHSSQRPSVTAPGGDHLSAAPRAGEDVDFSVLQDAQALARAAQPDVVVNTLLSSADPAQALINLSSQARLLVLGSRSEATKGMSLLASKRTLVSARAHCPVLLLGPVSAFGSLRKISRVIVGVAATRAGRAAVTFATAEAVRRDVTLHLVRVEPEPAAQLPGQPAGLQAVNALNAQAREIHRNYPGLTVLASSVTGHAAESLPAYSDSSSILVVGCRQSNDRWSTRLGPVTTWVTHRSRGPVVVVGFAHSPDGPRSEAALPEVGSALVL
ncbi:MAG: universal stress protein [Jatrophihabitantaceae bacterium]